MVFTCLDKRDVNCTLNLVLRVVCPRNYYTRLKFCHAAYIVIIYTNQEHNLGTDVN